MKIAVASDHGGFALKELVKKHLEQRNLEVLDLGTHSEESVDYPVYGRRCAEAVASGEADLGIVCCGTGIGISIAANKVKGIRCGLCTSVEMAHLTKQHNNANMIALGGRTTAPGAWRWRSSMNGWIPTLRAADTRDAWICSTKCRSFLACFLKKGLA